MEHVRRFLPILKRFLLESGSHLGSKLYLDTRHIIFTLRYIDRAVPGFIKIGISSLILIYIARGSVNGALIPYSIAYIVDGLKDNGSRLFIYGIALLGLSGALFVATELALMVYFKRLTRSVVSMKRSIISRIAGGRVIGDDREDLVGKIANDVDIIVWNINGVLTTLPPNLFTTAVSIVTVYSFNHISGSFVLATSIPYIIYADIYSRKVEAYRSIERRAYSQSIVYIKNIVYGEKLNGDLDKTLASWNWSIDKVIWLDRYYWSAGLATSLASMMGIALIAEGEMREGRMGIASLAGLLSASLTAHFGMLNAMWALCVQAQAVAAVKRVVSHLMEIETVGRRA